MDLKEPEIFCKIIKVTPEDIDELNHVNNVIYLQWVQDLAHEHWVSRATPDLLKFKWVALNHFIEYKRPAFIGDIILGKTFIGKTEGVRCDRFAEFYKDDQLIVKARSQWCMVEEATLKPVRVPHGMYELFLKKD
jgi:acyl-CoA thioester hydrolase